MAIAHVADQDVVNELLLSSRVGLTVVPMFCGEKEFQLGVGANKIPIRPQSVPESELLVPPNGVVRHEVQMSGPVTVYNLDKETSVGPPVQVWRNVMPVV